MTAVGEWLLDFDWEIDGTYETINIEFRPDFTVDSGNGGVGDWAEVDGMVVMRFSNGPSPVFAGLRIDNSMVGIGTVGNGFNASWRARRVSDQVSAGPGQSPVNPTGATSRFLRAAAD